MLPSPSISFCVVEGMCYVDLFYRYIVYLNARTQPFEVSCSYCLFAFFFQVFVIGGLSKPSKQGFYKDKTWNSKSFVSRPFYSITCRFGGSLDTYFNIFSKDGEQSEGWSNTSRRQKSAHNMNPRTARHPKERSWSNRIFSNVCSLAVICIKYHNNKIKCLVEVYVLSKCV